MRSGTVLGLRLLLSFSLMFSGDVGGDALQNTPSFFYEQSTY